MVSISVSNKSWSACLYLQLPNYGFRAVSTQFGADDVTPSRHHYDCLRCSRSSQHAPSVLESTTCSFPGVSEGQPGCCVLLRWRKDKGRSSQENTLTQSGCGFPRLREYIHRRLVPFKRGRAKWLICETNVVFFCFVFLFFVVLFFVDS